MKKLLIILLALVCTFTMFSCGDDGVTVKDFAAAVNATNPSVVTVSITQQTSYGPLAASFVTTYAEDGSFTVDYSIEKFNDVSADEDKSVTTGKITCDKDGNYSDGGALTGANPAATGAKFNFNKKKMTSSISADGKILTAQIKAENTKAVLGVEYAQDVTLVITQNEGKVVSYTIAYVTEIGAVNVVCSYQ